MASVEPIDLLHLGHGGEIASYLVETDEGPALVDCGHATNVAALEAGLAARGVALQDVPHLLLTHIHLDHAGAAGVLVREHPGLRVYVSEVGAPHLVDPSRLERSARRFYGERYEREVGELAPVPEERLEILGERVLGLECFASPGHATHHVCFLHGDGTLYAGDAAGVRLQPGRTVLAPTPPPDIDVETWLRTIEEIGRRAPQRLALCHFGVVADVERHLAELELNLLDWAESVEGGASEEEFVAYARAELADAGEDVAAWEHAFPFPQWHVGLERWARKRAAG